MIPEYGDKYDADAVYTPDESVTGEAGLPDFPPAVILGFQEALRDAAATVGAELSPHPARQFGLFELSETVGFLPVNDIGVGAPVAAIATEKAIAAGASVVVMLGGCAAFQPDTPPETVLLPTSAVRDEGASYHYLPDGESVEATASLLAQLEDTFAASGFETERGPTWTTSALFRETLPEIEHYRERGFVSLCMESAAIWAVCQYRGVETATVHFIDDYLSREAWVEDRETSLPDLLGPTRRALETYVTDGA